MGTYVQFDVISKKFRGAFESCSIEQCGMELKIRAVQNDQENLYGYQVARNCKGTFFYKTSTKVKTSSDKLTLALGTTIGIQALV